ncbi:hypothetical protein MSIBF_A40003 [groundwater metagenome]|uniref:Uncharacterized protein n=1 Tax=groundwater metagenome TaxID=717931 RepID=A0A098ED89_9ZZZZ
MKYNYTYLNLKQFLEDACFIVEIEKFENSPFGYLRAINISFTQVLRFNVLLNRM